ncbi:hypothetical protein [Nonomuraea sp. NPDC002799]
MVLSSEVATPARFLLLGDCHAGPIGQAAKAASIPFCGGPIGTASEFTVDFFDGRESDISFRKPEAEMLYRSFLAELGVTSVSRVSVPLVSTFGFSVHLFAHSDYWRIYRDRDGSLSQDFLSSRLFDEIIIAMAPDALNFYRCTRGLGLRVLAVMAPQRIPGRCDKSVFMAAQNTVCRTVSELGVDVVDLRASAVDETGLQRPELCDVRSPFHGNLAFGRLILADLLARGL